MQHPQQQPPPWPPPLAPPAAFWVPPGDIEGTVPQGLEGAYFRLGPAPPQRGEHAFDTQGLLVRLVFSAGRVHVAVAAAESDTARAEGAGHGGGGGERFLRHATPRPPAAGWAEDGPGLLSELTTFLRHRGWLAGSGAQGQGGRARPRAPARPRFVVAPNAGLAPCGGSLLCLSAFGRPVVVDPHSLSSLGGGGARRPQCRAARARSDPHHPGGPRVVFVAVEEARRRPGSDLVISEVAPDGKLLERREHAVSAVVYPGDFLLLRHYYVFHLTPYWAAGRQSRWREPQVTLGYQAALGAMQRADPTVEGRLIFIPRGDRTGQPFGVDAGGLFISSFGGVVADATEHSQLLFTAVCHSNMQLSPPGVQWLYDPKQHPGRLCVLSVDLEKRVLETRQGDGATVELPSVHSDRGCLPCRYVFSRARPEASEVDEGAAPRGPADFFTHVLKADVVGRRRQAWRSPGGAVGDVLFVPPACPPEGAAEDDGWVLAQLGGGEGGTCFAVLDAAEVDRGPVCTVHLRHPLPPALASCFVHGAGLEPPPARPPEPRL